MQTKKAQDLHVLSFCLFLPVPLTSFRVPSSSVITLCSAHLEGAKGSQQLVACVCGQATFRPRHPCALRGLEQQSSYQLVGRVLQCWDVSGEYVNPPGFPCVMDPLHICRHAEATLTSQCSPAQVVYRRPENALCLLSRANGRLRLFSG